MNKCIILANGKAPKKGVILYLQQKNYSTLICADGGANTAKKYNVIPDIIIGDLDSISSSTLDYYKNKSEIIKVDSQYSTDVEKCLSHAIKNSFSEAILIGVTGDRLDHTLCNLGIVLKFFNKVKIKIIAENSILVPYKGRHIIKTYPSEIISLYGFDQKTFITSKGLKYPLKARTLPFGKREGTSNAALGDQIELDIKGGIIFLVRDFNKMIKNDLF